MFRLVNGQFQHRTISTRRLLVCGALMVFVCIAFTAFGWFMGSR
jgi:hypothetical protein